jgi:Putative polyhydroxyalkanoic acid system protein (PHA_gran_rgn)
LPTSWAEQHEQSVPEKEPVHEHVAERRECDGRLGARRRIETGFARLIHQLPGSGGASSQTWDGDRLTFTVGTMGQTIAGVVDVQDVTVTMQIDLPGVLGMIANGLKGRLQKAGQLLLTKL